MFYVYVLLNKLTGRIYIGQTKNLEHRVRWHNEQNFDKRAYTKLNRGEWILVYHETFKTRKEAIRREKELKSSRGRNFIHTEILKE